MALFLTQRQFIQIIERKKSAGKTLKGTDFERSFLESLENYFLSNKSQVKHYQKFLGIKFWNFKERKFIEDYFLDLERIVFDQVNSFGNRTFDNI